MTDDGDRFSVHAIKIFISIILTRLDLKADLHAVGILNNDSADDDSC